MTMYLQSSHSSEGPMGWLTFERRNWLCACVGALALGFAIGNGHTTQNAVQDIAAREACEHVVANKAIVVAKKAIKGATSDTAPIPATSDLPRDNCPHIAAAK